MSGQAKATGGNVVLWVAAAFACTFAANHSCNYILVSDSQDSSENFTRGLWQGQRQYGGACGYIFAGIALIMSIAAAVPAMQGKASVSSVASFAIKSCLFQGLTLLFLSSSACWSNTGIPYGDNVCVMDQGAKLAISATVLWFMAALASCCTGAVIMMEQQKEEGQGEP